MSVQKETGRSIVLALRIRRQSLNPGNIVTHDFGLVDESYPWSQHNTGVRVACHAIHVAHRGTNLGESPPALAEGRVVLWLLLQRSWMAVQCLSFRRWCLSVCSRRPAAVGRQAAARSWDSRRRSHVSDCWWSKRRRPAGPMTATPPASNDRVDILPVCGKLLRHRTTAQITWQMSGYGGWWDSGSSPAAACPVWPTTRKLVQRRSKEDGKSFMTTYAT